MAETQHTATPNLEEALAHRLQTDAASRKKFLKMVGGVGAAGSLAALISACGGGDTATTAPPPSTAPTTPPDEEPPAEKASKKDLEILNYALTLEYLEAKFYADVIKSGEVKDKALAETVKLFGETEQQHVDQLKSTVEDLGGKAAKDPEGDFSAVIEGGPEMILMTAAVVENLGAAAYLGQAPLIKSPDILAAALSIHSVEARHAAAINQAAGIDFTGSSPLEGSIPDGPFAVPMDMAAVLKAVEPYLPKPKSGKKN